MPSRRRKRESGGENASTNVGSNFISDTIDIEDDNHDDNNDDDISNEEEEQVRDCPMKKLSVSKSNVIHFIETLKEIDLEAQKDFINELPDKIKNDFHSTCAQNANKSDSFVLEITLNTFKHSVYDLEKFENHMDDEDQESVGVLQFSVVLVAACSSSIGQMFDSSEEAQTLGALKLEILDLLKKETIFTLQHVQADKSYYIMYNITTCFWKHSLNTLERCSFFYCLI